MTTTPPGGKAKALNGSNGSVWPKVIAGILIFLGGMAVGYLGIPLENAQEIAIIQEQLRNNRESLNELKIEVREMSRKVDAAFRRWPSNE